MNWKNRLLNEKMDINFKNTLRLTFFCDEGRYSKGKSFSNGVANLLFDYDCEISWVYCDQWFGFGVKFDDKNLPPLKVECDTLEDGIFGLLSYLEGDKND